MAVPACNQQITSWGQNSFSIDNIADKHHISIVTFLSFFVLSKIT